MHSVTKQLTLSYRVYVNAQSVHVLDVHDAAHRIVCKAVMHFSPDFAEAQTSV